MKKLIFLAAAIFFAIAGFVFFNYISADVFNKSSPNDALAVGATVENFKLIDTSGAEKSLDDLKGKNGAVLVFVSAQCPVVKSYNKRISEFAVDFAAKGVNVIGINSNHTESPEQVKSHAEEKYNFPVLIDKGNVFADKLGASVTPEIFYLNEKNILVYHGAIDNSRSGDNITENYLRDAVEANLGGKSVVKPNANAFGCSMKRV
jgi:peroxiredoxin